MTITIAATNEVLLSSDEQSAARDFVQSLGGQPVQIGIGQDAELPVEVARVFELVLEAMAEGRPVSIAAMPENLTTTAAAGLLGLSRPTLMKLVREGRIPAHKVGSHHRLRSADVLTLKDELRLERLQADFDVMDLEDELASNNP